MAVMVLAPGFNGIAAEAVPDATVVPFIFTVAFASAVAAIIFTDVVAFVTVAA